MPDEVIQVENRFYVLSTSPRIDDRTMVLKHGDTFAVFDRFGDIEGFGSGELGLYHCDTRFLSRLTLRLGVDRPLLLSSTIKDDNVILAVDLTNPDARHDDELAIIRGTLHIFRSKFLWNARCHERLRLHNYGQGPVRLQLFISYDADFADIFEVRGAARPARGERLPAEVGERSIVHAYRGLDNRLLRTRIEFDPAPAAVQADEVRYDIDLGPGQGHEFHTTIGCEIDSERTVTVPVNRTAGTRSLRYEAAAGAALQALDGTRRGDSDLASSNEQFNDWVNRSVADLRMMLTETQQGLYPYAGIPWFCTPFGRDGLITALECLSFNPGLARGVLSFLAAHQADQVRDLDDAQPGKILHETRRGEMALLGEVPFRHYYGTIDATPLFVMLAGAYFERTGDHDFCRTLWPHVERALEWIDRSGDIDGDGFVEYARRTPQGLVNQGWKDSHDSVFHADGTSAEGPIALCEVQGYVYAAKRAGSHLASICSTAERSLALDQQAEQLRQRFESQFWCEELGTYALALDGHKRPCRVATSNAGHALLTGIASPERAARVAATLTGPASFSGWGVRTLAEGYPRYNPMSYHNGSIWPHDNALIAAGLARYGLKQAVTSLFTGLFDATLFFDLHRLPELFCGFPRRPGEAPTLYPVACSPQAWAAGAVFSLLESCLGLQVRATDHTVTFAKPALPPSLQRVTIRNLPVGGSRIDLAAIRHGEREVSVNVLRREGAVEVVVLP